MRTLTFVFIGMVLMTSACSKKTADTLVKNENVGQTKITPVHLSRDQVAVWMDATRGDSQEALESLDANRKHIGTVQPVMYTVKDGKVVLHYRITANSVDDIVYTCNKSEPKIKIRPTFGNTDWRGSHGDEVLKILENPGLRKAALDEIAKVAADKNYDGVDLDWQGGPEGKGKSDLLAGFIEELAVRVHKAGKTLSVLLHYADIDGSWKKIASAVDRVEVVGFYSYQGDPILSTDRMEAQIWNSLEVIPRAKLVYGLPLFGYEWDDWTPRNKEIGLRQVGITWKEWIREKSPDSYDHLGSLKESRDKDGNPSATFVKYLGWSSSDGGSDPVKCRAHYEDAVSINAKMRAALKPEYRVGQFIFWRIGGEDPAVWKTLK